MAWQFPNTWANGQIPSGADMNAIAYDHRHWGGNMDAAGYQLNSLAAISGYAATALPFTVNGAERMRIAADGKVGINTTSATSKLSVNDAPAGNSANCAMFSQTADGIGVIVNRSGAANPMELWLGINQVSLYSEIQSSRAGIGYYPLILNRSGGNVGIGTASPLNTLSVIAASNPSGVAQANQITIAETTNNAGYRLNLGYSVVSAVWAGVIQANSSGVGTPLLLNPSGGNVGIGINVPSSKLTVSGDIETRVGGQMKLRPLNDAWDFEAQAVQITGGYMMQFGSASFANIAFGYTHDGRIRIMSLAQFASNAAAIGAGYAAGDLYAVTGTSPRQVAIVF